MLLLTVLLACDDKVTDFDGDGFPVDVDCDDTDSAVFPNADEICNSVDDDCDGEVDEDPTDGVIAYWDGDGDGYGGSEITTVSRAGAPPAGSAGHADDCDDLSAAASPVGEEVCDGLDNNCNGTVDDFALDQTLWYYDADGDSYGNPSTSTQACDAPDSYVDNGADCDDTDAAVNPDQDWYIDADQDGYGNSDYRLTACGEQAGFSSIGEDCDDGDAAISPGADELCDDLDNNCDGIIDDETAIDAITVYTDNDGDGYGDVAVMQCEADEGHVAADGDCDDSDAEINPVAIDWCGDGVDNDCDSNVDTPCLRSVEDAALKITGALSYDYFGVAADFGGDLNGDGAPDLVASAYLNDDGATAGGQAYVFFGPLTATGERSVDTADMGLIAENSSDYLGYAVQIGGDVDGNGYDELVVGSYLYDHDSLSSSGAIYLIYGPATGQISAADADFSMFGVATQDYLGQYTVGVAADVNDDGYDDVYGGAIYYDSDGNSSAGMIALFYGPVSGTAELDEADVQVIGSGGARYVGYDAAFVDIDGDGTADMLYGESSQGTIYGLYGPLSGSLTASDASVSFTSGESDYTGSRIRTGDFDSDGYIDMVLGARSDDNYAQNAGEVVAIYGPLSAAMTSKAVGFSVYGDDTSRSIGAPGFGFDVGDLDGDGIDDLAFGSPNDSRIDSSSGAVFVYYGPLSGTGSTVLDSPDLSVLGAASSDALGWAAVIGDVTQDGTNDLILGARGENSSTGAVYIFDGTAL